MLKYRPELPVKPLQNLSQARRWAAELEHWYNHEHHHRAIGFVTPQQRHERLDEVILNERAKVYAIARQAYPSRCSGNACNWAPITEVHLNPQTVKEHDEPVGSVA